MKDKIMNLPNMLSMSRVVIGIFFLAIFLVVRNANCTVMTSIILQTTAFLLFIIAIITDGLDGYYARKLNIVTDFGKHFDPLADSIFFIIVFFTFMAIGLLHPVIFIIITARELYMHLYLRPYVKKRGGSLPANIYGKLKTVFQCVLSLIVLFLLLARDIFRFMGMEFDFSTAVINITAAASFITIAILSVGSLAIYITGVFSQQKSR